VINRETVLILGAGSSHEAGFPLGRQLINEIYELAMGETSGFFRRGQNDVIPYPKSNAELLWCLLDITGEKREDGASYSVDFIKEFANDLWDAKPPSIDDFLFNRREYSLIGKLCILFVLSRYEDTNRFKPFQLKEKYPSWGWYEYLWHKLVDGAEGNFDKLKQNKVKIITFNYDRSLEHFLFTAIKATFGLHSKECEVADFFNHIPVKHVYGELGVLSWKFNCLDEYRSQLESTNNFIPLHMKTLFRIYGNGEFGANQLEWESGIAITGQDARIKLAQHFLNRAKEIKTYQEVDKKDYSDIFKDVKRIYLLGCGYHEQNIKALGIENFLLKGEVHICGTAVGFSGHEMGNKQALLNSYTGKTSRFHREWQNSSSHYKIESFLRTAEPFDG